MNYESLRQVLAQPLTGLVPSDSYRAQVLQMSPALAPILDAYPRGTAATKDPNAVSYFSSGRQAIDEDSGMFRVDYLASAQATFFARFSTDQFASVAPNGVLRDVANTDLKTPNAVINFQHTFSPTILNSARLGFNRAEYDQLSATVLPYAVSITGFSSLSSPSGDLRHDNSYSIVDNATFVKGRHTIKAGIEIRRMEENKGKPGGDGSYSYNTAALKPCCLLPAQVRHVGQRRPQPGARARLLGNRRRPPEALPAA